MKLTSLRQNVFYMTVCSDSSPRYIDPTTESKPTNSMDDFSKTPLYTKEFVEKFNRAIVDNGFVSGTSLGWRLVETCPACPCEDHEGYFHYMCDC